MKMLPNAPSMHSLIPKYMTPSTHLLLKFCVKRTSVTHKHGDIFILSPFPTKKQVLKICYFTILFTHGIGKKEISDSLSL